jgi:hypothetical protein
MHAGAFFSSIPVSTTYFVLDATADSGELLCKIDAN